MAFIKTTAIKRIRRMRRRIKVIPGGTSAGKTYAILPILIDKATKNKGLEISVVSQSMPHLRKGAIRDFKKIMTETGRWHPKRWNQSNMTYTFANGAYIEFFSVDDEQKARGPRRDILYMNEANKTKWDTFYQLLIRTKFDVYIDYNPTSEFWVNHELIGRNDVELLTLTYKDNEATPRAVISEFQVNLRKAFYQIPRSPTDARLFDPKNVMNNHWANWCRVYVFGQIGTLEGAVFKDWTTIAKIPEKAKLRGYGLDFGYSNDPTALIAVYELDGQYYIRQLIYKTHLTSSALIAEMKKLGVLRKMPIVADSADPRMIDELCDGGFDVFGADKGPDSINFGIDLIQDNGFIVEETSTDIIQELRNYLWRENRTGRTLNKPIDDWNHLLDAFRYFAMEYFTPKSNRGASSGVSYSTM